MGETYLESIKVYSSKILTVTLWTWELLCNLIAIWSKKKKKKGKNFIIIIYANAM